MKTKRPNPFKQAAIIWLIATIAFIVCMAVIGSVDVILESRFPNP